MAKENHASFFEGSEKLLEIWFTGDQENKAGDLRKIPQQKLQNLLKLVHCEVISFTSNEHIDAYVLSESSMFVARRRFILKTCGTTTPLQCIQVLLLLVQQYSGFTEVEKVFYSHKNFKKPEYQTKIYRDFRQEVSFLDSCFKCAGITYCQTSKVDKDDRWYLYVLYPELTMEGEHELCITNEKLCSFIEPDQTIEITMSDLNPIIMALFYKNTCISAEDATKRSGIDKLIPMMHIDGFLFDPCGYSMNGIHSNGAYMTIHITPEIECSYVSFETNIPLSSYKELIKRVLQTFQPRKFVVTVFANKKSVASCTPAEVKKLQKVDGWHQVTSDICKLNDYDMSVAFYSKFPS